MIPKIAEVENRNSISGADLLILILLFPYFAPAYISSLPYVNTIISYMKVASFLLSVYLFLKERVSLNSFIVLIIIINGSLLISTLAGPMGSVEEWFKNALTMFGLAFLVASYGEENFERILFISYYILLVEIIINVATQFLFPQGIYYSGLSNTTVSFLLGMENRFLFSYVTYLLIGSILLSWGGISKWQYSFMLILINVSLVKAWSVGAMLCVFLYDLFYVFKRQLKRFVNTLSMTMLWIIPYILVVVIRVQKYLSTYIQIYLRKSATLGREYLWDRVLIYIRRRPIIGYGIQSYENNLRAMIFSHPHNHILYILFQGGLLGFLINIILYCICCAHLERVKGSDEYYYALVTLCALMLALIVDSWTSTSYFYFLFFIVYSIEGEYFHYKFEGIRNEI